MLHRTRCFIEVKEAGKGIARIMKKQLDEIANTVKDGAVDFEKGSQQRADDEMRALKDPKTLEKRVEDDVKGIGSDGEGRKPGQAVSPDEREKAADTH